MKKILLLLTLCCPIFLSAQLVSDDFESYTVGSFDSQWDAANWVGWFSAASGTEISNDQALSGTNSLKVETNDDIVALLGLLNTEGYEVKFNQYIPSGNGSYFNLQNNYTNAAGGWMMQVYFDAGTGLGTIESGGGTLNFPFAYDEWGEVSIVLNFITKVGTLSYNGAPIANFSTEATPQGGVGTGINQLNAINFFGACLPAGCNALTYYDDISITPIPAPPFNATVINPTPPSRYTEVPDGLQLPITLAADIFNIGAMPITNATVTFTLKDGSGATVYTEVSDPVASIPSGEAASVTGTGSFTMSGVDNYTMDYEVNIAEMDGEPGDDLITLQAPYAVNNTSYAKDNGDYTNGIGIGTGTIVDPMLGQIFEFNDMASIEGIFFAYQAGSAGIGVQGLIYSLDAAGVPDTVVAITEISQLDDAGMPAAPVFKTLEFSDDVELVAGDYLFAVQSLGMESINISSSLSVYTPETVYAGLPDANGDLAWQIFENFNIRQALAVRPLVSLVGVNVDESAVNYVNDLAITPNPTTDFITIDLELLENQNLTIDVMNTHGQQLKSIVENNTFGGQYQLNLKEYPTGIYFVRLQIGEQVITRRVILTK